jgi:hypothetical protein
MMALTISGVLALLALQAPAPAATDTPPAPVADVAVEPAVVLATRLATRLATLRADVDTLAADVARQLLVQQFLGEHALPWAPLSGG